MASKDGCLDGPARAVPSGDFHCLGSRRTSGVPPGESVEEVVGEYLFSSLVLPEEVFAKIFSKLELSADIGNARQVCKHWSQAVPGYVTRLDLVMRERLVLEAFIKALPHFPGVKSLRFPPVFADEVGDNLLRFVAQYCPRLESLDVSGFQMQSFRFTPEVIGELLRACQRLQRLRLGSKGLGLNPSPALLLPFSPVRPSLRSLILEGCALPSPSDIAPLRLALLRELSLINCSFPLRSTDADMYADITALFTLMQQLTGLTSLCLSLFNFTARANIRSTEGRDGQRPEPPWLHSLGCLHALETLTLCGICHVSAVPYSWARSLTRLRSLRLLENMELTSIMPVFRMTGLTSLAVAGCQMPALPSAVGALTNLQALAFTRSMDLRSVPEALVRLTQLSYLDLSHNQNLRGLPSLVTLTRLHTLALASCFFLRSLPAGIGSIPSLRLLDVSGCLEAFVMPAALQPDGTRVLSGEVKVVWPLSAPSLPSLCSPFPPELQLHPAYRNRFELEAREYGEVLEPAVDIEEVPDWDFGGHVGYLVENPEELLDNFFEVHAFEDFMGQVEFVDEGLDPVEGFLEFPDVAMVDAVLLSAGLMSHEDYNDDVAVAYNEERAFSVEGLDLGLDIGLGGGFDEGLDDGFEERLGYGLMDFNTN